MTSPWDVDLSVVDAHVHFFSHRFFSLLAGQKNATVAEVGAALGWEMPDERPEEFAGRWVAELHRYDVARAVLIASLPGDEGSVKAAVRAYPKRFYGFFMVNPLQADAPELVERALEGGWLQGVCLFPAMHRYGLHDERVEAVVQRLAARPGTVVFVHCGVLSIGVRKKLGLPSPFDMRYSNPIDVHGLALRHPNLPFIIPHFGAGYFREALMVAGMCANVYLDTSSSNDWIRFQESDLNLRTVFRKALEVAGARRLLFGTDSSFFPRGWNKPVFDEQARLLYELGVSAEDAQAIFGGNIQRLLARAND